MQINFVANFQNGLVGEVGDATHLARELEALGHTVTKVPQDIWKAYVDGVEPGHDWVLPQKADINIICKWHHFSDGTYIVRLREVSEAPVFYWVWDYMQEEPWHISMVWESDLYLGNDVKNGNYNNYDNAYYFPFDCIDNEIKVPSYDIGTHGEYVPIDKLHDVTFFGSWIGQGDRQEWLKEINKTTPITVFSWNPQDWPEEFTDVHPAVYGEDFAKEVSQSKIVLGFSVDPSTWGYWSNRVGKVMGCKGFLLQQYAPGMELSLSDGCEYFSTIEEAREKIDHYLIADFEREKISRRGCEIARDNLTSKARVRQLVILIERFLKEHESWKI